MGGGYREIHARLYTSAMDSSAQNTTRLRWICASRPESRGRNSLPVPREKYDVNDPDSLPSPELRHREPSFTGRLAYFPSRFTRRAQEKSPVNTETCEV